MKIELCSAHIESLFLAEKYKFDRVELCQSLEQGGLTPSIGFQQKALEFLSFETHVLIRHRAGGFVYSELEKEIMLKDMHQSVSAGVHGLVVGALLVNNAEFELDLPFLKEIKTCFPNIDLTFHRAFDELLGKDIALKSLIELGFRRVLTSGGLFPIEKNCDDLKSLQNNFGKQIELMLGGGINAENVRFLSQEINPAGIHFSGTILLNRNSKSTFNLDQLIPSEKKIQEILETIKNGSNDYF
jgi:copper homeostasis protein